MCVWGILINKYESRHHSVLVRNTCVLLTWQLVVETYLDSYLPRNMQGYVWHVKHVQACSLQMTNLIKTARLAQPDALQHNGMAGGETKLCVCVCV